MKTDSFKQNMNLLNILNESETLNEKINKDNLEINNKIQRALRSKGEARKLEPELAKHGIKVNYDNSQGTTMVGPNGKRLSDDKNHVYGPSQAGFNNTHAKTDRSYERWSKDYGNRAEEYELKLKQLKNMDRDDIIRKYNDKSTEEALKAHQAEIERIEKWAKDYRDDEKKYAKSALHDRIRGREYRRTGHDSDPSSNYSHPIDKTDAPEKYNRETGKYEKSGMSSADKVDYLNYLTKKSTGYRKDGNKYWDGRAYNPADDMNKKLNQYKDLKSDESRAKEHLDFENKYYGVKSDDDVILDVIKTNTVDTIMFFTNKGKMYRTVVDNIPNGTNTTKGVMISSLVKLDNDEKVMAISSLHRKSTPQYIIFVTKNGMIKKSYLEEYTKTNRNTGIAALNVKDGDEVVDIIFQDEEDMVLVTKNGMSIKFATKDVTPIGRVAMGVKGIKLAEGDEVIAALPIHKVTDQIAIFTDGGLGKKVDINELPMQARGGKGTIIYKPTEQTGNVVGSAMVSDEDLILLSGNKTSICFSAKDIPSLGKTGIGNIMIKNNRVLSVTKI